MKEKKGGSKWKEVSSNFSLAEPLFISFTPYIKC